MPGSFMGAVCCFAASQLARRLIVSKSILSGAPRQPEASEEILHFHFRRRRPADVTTGECRRCALLSLFTGLRLNLAKNSGLDAFYLNSRCCFSVYLKVLMLHYHEILFNSI